MAKKYHVFVIIIVLLIIGGCASTDMKVNIPPKESFSVDVPDYPLYEAEIDNQSMDEIQVVVLSKIDRNKIAEFMLNPQDKASVNVSRSGKLVLINQSESEAKVTIMINPLVSEDTNYVNVPRKQLVLSNKSDESIALFLSSKPDPLLSPHSTTRVKLKIDQEVYFKVGPKQYLLFTVNEEMKHGQVIDISMLIKERRKELGLSNSPY